MRSSAGCVAVLGLGLMVFSARADDWPGFRGPKGSGVSERTGLPVTWSDAENVAWKTDLPGPGTSSPIVAGDRVFVTCYSGYGVDRGSPGDEEKLVRHAQVQPAGMESGLDAIAKPRKDDIAKEEEDGHGVRA